MKFGKTILTAGFAMFSMFFGSGNLVFPLEIGMETMDSAPFAILGLLVTGVLVPFLGLFGVILYAGNRTNFFASIGKVPAFLVTLTMLALLGPFGVVPRCIIVGYGGVQLFMPELPLWVFSLLFCLATMLLIWKHDRVIPIIGRILTPVLLGGVLLLIIAGMILGPEIPRGTGGESSFVLGLKKGYLTMDLMAGFFFCATTVGYLRAHLRSDDGPSVLTKISLKSSVLGGSLLGLVYVGFVYLGAFYAESLSTVNPEQMLAAIAGATLGSFAIPVASVTIAMACLTTAAVLAMLFAEFLDQDIAGGKIGTHPSVIITLVGSFFVSLIGFDSLRVILGTTLQVAYPALIVLTLGNIAHKLWRWNFAKWGFWATLFVSFVWSYCL